MDVFFYEPGTYVYAKADDHDCHALRMAAQAEGVNILWEETFDGYYRAFWQAPWERVSELVQNALSSTR
ncbi:MAG: hypothetical protein AAFV29_23200 [Myxococcota bacterium]